jgi:HEAT repeat protein
MKWLRVVAVVLFSSPAVAQSAMPDWMEHGFAAALADSIAAPQAAIFLSRINVVPARQVTMLIDEFLSLLSDSNNNVRAAAARSLAQLATADRAASVIDKLLPLLGDSNSNAREAAAQSLAQLATADRAASIIDKLLPLLGDSNSNVREAAAQSLGQLATGDRAASIIDKLLQLLGHSNSDDVRVAAAQSLGQFATGDRAASVIDKLLQLLGDSDSDVRDAAVQSLGQLATGDRAASVIDKLLPLLGRSNTNEVRAAAAQSLGQIATGDRAAGIFDKLLPLLGDSNSDVRAAAAKSLGQLATGDRAASAIDKLVPLVGDSDSDVRDAAVQSLGRLAAGDRAAGVIVKLLPLLGHSNGDVRASAAQSLGQLATGDRAASVIDKLLPLLGDPISDVRAAAAQSLGRLATGDRAASAIDKLVPLVGDSDSDVREAAAQSLRQLATGDRAAGVIDKLLPFLGDSNSNEVRAAAAQSLGQLATGDRAASVVDKLLPLLANSDSDVRLAAVQSLGRIATGDRAAGVIDRLVPLLSDSNTSMRLAAVQSLSQLATGDRAFSAIDKLLPVLGDSIPKVRLVAVQSLSQLVTGDRAAGVIDKLLPLMRDGTRFGELSPLLIKFGPGSQSATFVALKLVDESDLILTGQFRALGHIAGAGGEQSELLLAWLGQAPNPPLPGIANKPNDAHKILALLALNWNEIAKSNRLREESEARVMEIINAACLTTSQAQTATQWIEAAAAWLFRLPVQGPMQRCWTPEQRKTLDVFLASFQATHSSHEKALADHLAHEDAVPLGQWITWSILGWALLWLAFLFVFPWSRTVQAVFFWNPKIRGLLSLWFMPMLLFAVPPLRRRLLAPVRDDLIAAARLEQMPQLAFFGQARVQLDGGQPVKTEDALPRLGGTVVLRGDAGLGKTSALRWLAAKASGPVAFLSARDCAAGVDTAIARLIHDVQETGFVRSMVHAGTLTVMVDGLNEVSADTREKISSFARDMSKGNVFLSTQPIEWKEPPGARVVDLLPLDRAEAERFLLTRPVGFDEIATRHGAAYVDAVQTFLRIALDDAPSDDDRRAAQLILSNPFDLAFAADLLAQGHMPTATSLIDEAFRLADQGEPGHPGYRQIMGLAFPLVQFGRHAVDMRVNDRNWFKPDEFAAELACLLDRRLLVRRAVRAGGGAEEERIQFRHDRVWDFFIAAAFAADSNLMLEHLADPRFRGSYLRIAETWKPDAAIQVREQLVVVAAEHGDHTTSDEFIKRLEARRRLRSGCEQPQTTAA